MLKSENIINGIFSQALSMRLPRFQFRCESKRKFKSIDMIQLLHKLVIQLVAIYALFFSFLEFLMQLGTQYTVISRRYTDDSYGDWIGISLFDSSCLFCAPLAIEDALI